MPYCPIPALQCCRNVSGAELVVLNFTELGKNKKLLFGIIITTAIMIVPAFSEGFGWLQGLVPLPIFYFLVTLGEKQGRILFGISAMAAAVIALATGTIQILFYSFMLAPLGFLLAQAVFKRETITKIGIKGIALLATIWIIFGVTYTVIKQSNPYTDALDDINKEITVTYQTIENQYKDLPLETKQELNTAFERLQNLIPKIMPSLLALMILTTVWLNLFIGHLLLKKKNPELTPWENFREWRLPDILIWGAIASGFFLILPITWLKIVGLNLLIIYGTLYFFQGLSVLASLLEKWSVPSPARVAIYFFLLLVLVYAVVFVIILGVADIWTDLRKVEKKEEVN